MRYNRKEANKAFNGNIILFATNSSQYGKRYEKRACCDSHMILWGDSKKNSVLICAKCGYINNEKSKIKQIAKNEESLWSKSEKEMFDIEQIKELDNLLID